ncbi:hypothetical protein V6N12_004828 [Hibiscus sabdariffa]|uniref:Retrovirus-related Pol polyprotein from transposon TNT 1-94-like beta-barrel domain-containing protein n=1 Tax=Hibiscus sabdariffa TaxID=183260 RepID=A0ABR2CMN5_9ROSI
MSLDKQNTGDLIDHSSAKTAQGSAMSEGNQPNSISDLQNIQAAYRLNATKQGSKSVTEYSNILQNLWQELDHYQCIQMSCSDDATTLKMLVEKDRIYAFLAGLNIDFDAVRVQILGKEDLPTLNEVIATIRAEEGRRGVMMIENSQVESSALIVKTFSERPARLEQQFPENKTGGRDSLWCTYCKKSRHTKEKCWKLHGKPQSANMNFTDKRGLARGQSKAYLSKQEEPTEQPFEFNREDIEKLKSLLESLEKPSSTGTSNLDFSGISSSFSQNFNVSETSTNKSTRTSWIIDSGATDHMTNSSQKFLTYIPCPSNKKITVADGSMVTVAGQGDIMINKTLLLKNVLHVPKLFTSLISIPKLVKDIHCCVLFYPTHCIFQEQETKRMIGRARKKMAFIIWKTLVNQIGP